MCVDYTDINNACLKDSFPLPRINQIVEVSTGHGMLSFLDAFSGYHQIPMYPSDVEKTSFITPHGILCDYAGKRGRQGPPPPPSYMDPITLYLSTRHPTERNKAHKLQIQAARFSLIDGQLFKRSFGGPYLKCMTPEQSQYVLAELHKGICGNHPCGRTLAH